VHGSSKHDDTQYTVVVVVVVVAGSGVITADVHVVDDKSGTTRVLRSNNVRMPLDEAKCRSSCSSSTSTAVL